MGWKPEPIQGILGADHEAPFAFPPTETNAVASTFRRYRGSVGTTLLVVLCCLPASFAQDTAGATYAGQSLVQWMAVLQDNLERDTDESWELCRKAANALGQMGPPAVAAVPLLIKTLKHRKVEPRDYAVDALGSIGPSAVEAVPAIIAAVDIPQTHVDYKVLANFRRLAAKALGRIGPEAQAAEAVLLLALQNEDLVYRVEAALALWNISRHSAALPALIAMLKQKGTDGPYKAVLALGEMGADAKPAAGALVATLQHPDADVQRAAAKVLVSFGPGGLLPVAEALAAGKAAPEPAAYVLGELLGQLREEVFYNRQLAAAKFRELAEPVLRAATPALVSLLADAREETRQDAIRALAQMGFPAAPFLVKTLAGENAVARTAALDALVRLELFLPRESPASEGVEAMKQKLVPPLLELLRQPDPKVRAAVCRILAEFALGRAPLETAEPQLRDALKDSDVAVRRYASKALEQLRTKDRPGADER